MKKIKWLMLAVSLVFLFTVIVTACSPSTTPIDTTTTTTATAGPQHSPNYQGITLNGAGGTFPAPLYTKWFDTYYTLTGVKVNYQAVGSGAGINQITAGTVDFGASDAIMTADQQAAAEAAGGPILHIPDDQRRSRYHL